MKNNQNVILAIVLSFLVILGWQHFIVGPKLEAERQRIEAEQARATDATPGTVTGTQAGAGAPIPGAAVPLGAPATVPSAAGTSAANAVVARDAALAASNRVAIDTPSLKGSINLQGGRLDDLLLARYRVTVERTSPLVELFSPVGSPHPYYAEFGWVAA
ncbi:MAG TPA: membrane protein insertase YidC, partial [Propylenella sp.]|nr:membrane protein insertase YidC [Propylenella sp.]